MAYLNRSETSVGAIVESIRDLWHGRSNAVGDVTLRDGEVTTVVAAINCGPRSRVLLSPKTASAADALPTTYVSAVTNGEFTLAHANDVSVDRTFGYAIQG